MRAVQVPAPLAALRSAIRLRCSDIVANNSAAYDLAIMRWRRSRWRLLWWWGNLILANFCDFEEKFDDFGTILTLWGRMLQKFRLASRGSPENFLQRLSPEAYLLVREHDSP
jgi:hypothetical protein